MLAYSSVEHMGIMALGVGIGAAASFGAMLHAVSHSLTKAMLFMAAGNILAVYKTKAASKVSGVMSSMPATGVLWIAGFLAITGMPPFGLFLSKFTIIAEMFQQGRIGIAVTFLAMLALIFIGMAVTFLNMAHGKRSAGPQFDGKPVNGFAIVPPLALGTLTLVLGLYIPPAVSELLRDVTMAIGGGH
jgi:hydrogenase-4 component F